MAASLTLANAPTTAAPPAPAGRYLIAAKYGPRMGIDLAYADDEWTIYVGMGTGWVRP